jgi:YfiH family protein
LIEQQRDTKRYVQFHHFHQFPELTHAIFTRTGGGSQPPYGSLNVSYSSGDSIKTVLHNRLLVLRTLDLQHYPCATLWQVHGANVAILNPDTWDDWRADYPYRSFMLELPEYPQGIPLTWTTRPRCKADAILTQHPGVALALSFADCVPIMLYDHASKVIGLVHAGWRGTARGIALATIEAMQAQFGSNPRDIYAGIGPSIGPCCYEVSSTVQHLFLGREQFADMPTAERFCNLVRESAVFSVGTRLNAPHLDLWQTNRNQLLMTGLAPEHIELSAICTSCNTHLFFSHRGEHGKTGRFPAILALRDKE